MSLKYKISIFLVSALLTTFGNIQAAIYYVKESMSGTGDGSSWGNASNDLQAMIQLAEAGDEIWIAIGSYKPNTIFDASGTIGARDAAFTLKSGVKIYGSFLGTETSLSQRVLGNDRTILSGDIGVSSNKTDNLHHVVLSINNDEFTLLDGVTITSGNANGEGFIVIDQHQIFRNLGGGLFTRGSKAKFSNIIFEYNECYTTNTNAFGGAIYALTSSIKIEDAIFRNNRSDAPSTAGGAGGAIYLLGNADTVGNTTIERTSFLNNFSKGSGGAIYAQHFSNLSLDDVTVKENNTSTSGGGLIIFGNVAQYNVVSIKNSKILKNTANGSGGGIMFSYYVDATILNTEFHENQSTGVGGGIYAIGGSANMKTKIDITNADFYKNHSNNNGGAFYFNEFSNSKTIHSKFVENSSSFNGGAFYIIGNANDYNEFTLEGNEFIRNSSASNGGVAYLASYNIQNIHRNKFYGNETTGAGGVFFIFNAAIPTPNESIYISNNIFYNNKANSSTLGGGAIFSSNNVRPSLINNTFYKNTSKFNGGALMVFNSSAAGAKVYNSIFYGNTSQTADNDIHKGAAAIFDIKNSLTQEYGVSNYDGMIVGQDPGFLSLDPLSEDFLKINQLSLVFDKGDSTFLPTTILTDIVGGDRIIGDNVDMGAFEFDPPITDPTQPQTITFNIATDKVYGDASFDPGATSSAGLTISYTSNNSQVAIIENGLIKIVGAGSALITANQLGNDDYFPADPVSQTLHVAKAPLTVKPVDTAFAQLINFPSFRLNYSGFVNGENESTLQVKPTITTSANPNSPAGTYSLVASGGSSNKYEFVYQEGTLTLQPTAVDKNKIEVWFSNSNTLSMNIDVDKSQAVTISLYTNLGQRIYSSTATLQPGRNQLSIPSNNMIPGVYIINVKGGSVHLDSKFIKR